MSIKCKGNIIHYHCLCPNKYNCFMVDLAVTGMVNVDFSRPTIYDNGFYAVITVNNMLYYVIICVL